MTDFKTFLERATDEAANEFFKVKREDNGHFSASEMRHLERNMQSRNSFIEGAKLPNELLLKCLEVLEFYSKKPEYKEIKYTDNWCDDYCPNDCKEHSVDRIGKFRPVAHGTGKAVETLNEIRSRLESEAK